MDAPKSPAEKEAMEQVQAQLVVDAPEGLALVLREYADKLGVPRRSVPKVDKSSQEDDDDGWLSFVESSSAGFSGSKASKRKEKARKKLEQEQGGPPQEKLSGPEAAMRDFVHKVLALSALCYADECCASLATGSLAQEYKVHVDHSFNGSTALHFAATNHSAACIRVLLSAGASALLRNNRGLMPLEEELFSSPDDDAKVEWSLEMPAVRLVSDMRERRRGSLLALAEAYPLDMLTEVAFTLAAYLHVSQLMALLVCTDPRQGLINAVFPAPGSDAAEGGGGGGVSPQLSFLLRYGPVTLMDVAVINALEPPNFAFLTASAEEALREEARGLGVAEKDLLDAGAKEKPHLLGAAAQMLDGPFAGKKLRELNREDARQLSLRLLECLLQFSPRLQGAYSASAPAPAGPQGAGAHFPFAARDMSPLVRAAKANDRVVVGMLLDHGAPVTDTDADGNTALHWVIRQATVRNQRSVDISLVDHLLQSGANVLAANRSGATPVHTAAGHGNAKALMALLEKEPAGARVMAHSKETPLHYAAKNSFYAGALILLSRGANVHVLSKNSETAADVAARHDDAEMKALLEAAAREPEGFTEDNYLNGTNPWGHYFESALNGVGQGDTSHSGPAYSIPGMAFPYANAPSSPSRANTLKEACKEISGPSSPGARQQGGWDRAGRQGSGYSDLGSSYSDSQGEQHDTQAKWGSLYKTRMCDSVRGVRICNYGAHCRFAHSESELRPNPYTGKVAVGANKDWVAEKEKRWGGGAEGGQQSAPETKAEAKPPVNAWGAGPPKPSGVPNPNELVKAPAPPKPAPVAPTSTAAVAAAAAAKGGAVKAGGLVAANAALASFEDEDAVGRRIFLGGLPHDANEEDVADALWDQFGRIEHVRIQRFKDERGVWHSKGFGFVQFEHSESARKAIAKHWVDVHGKKVEVKKATQPGRPSVQAPATAGAPMPQPPQAVTIPAPAVTVPAPASKPAPTAVNAWKSKPPAVTPVSGLDPGSGSEKSSAPATPSSPARDYLTPRELLTPEHARPPAGGIPGAGKGAAAKGVAPEGEPAKKLAVLEQQAGTLNALLEKLAMGPPAGSASASTSESASAANIPANGVPAVSADTGAATKEPVQVVKSTGTGEAGASASAKTSSSPPRHSDTMKLSAGVSPEPVGRPQVQERQESQVARALPFSSTAPEAPPIPQPQPRYVPPHAYNPVTAAPLQPQLGTSGSPTPPHLSTQAPHPGFAKGAPALQQHSAGVPAPPPGFTPTGLSSTISFPAQYSTGGAGKGAPGATAPPMAHAPPSPPPPGFFQPPANGISAPIQGQHPQHYQQQQQQQQQQHFPQQQQQAYPQQYEQPYQQQYGHQQQQQYAPQQQQPYVPQPQQQQQQQQQYAVHQQQYVPQPQQPMFTPHQQQQVPSSHAGYLPQDWNHAPSPLQSLFPSPNPPASTATPGYHNTPPRPSVHQPTLPIPGHPAQRPPPVASNGHGAPGAYPLGGAVQVPGYQGGSQMAYQQVSQASVGVYQQSDSRGPGGYQTANHAGAGDRGVAKGHGSGAPGAAPSGPSGDEDDELDELVAMLG